jgi:dipeptidyl aminopeptidase/acylaminoacyl peptidase
LLHFALSTQLLLPYNITVMALDFSGSGMSDGEFVTLGHHEQDDLVTVVEYLRACGTVAKIGVWGRSMGAATSLMYAEADPSIACAVLDSPFASLSELCVEVTKRYKAWIPVPAPACLSFPAHHVG